MVQRVGDDAARLVSTRLKSTSDPQSLSDALHTLLKLPGVV